MAGKFQHINFLISTFLACLPIISAGQQSAGIQFALNADPAYVISSHDGLPNDAVTCMVFDKSGFAWIGTAEGLVRWDGMKALAYLNDPLDSASITGNFIKTNCLKYDSVNDRLLAGTDDGLSIFDLKDNVFINYYPDENNKLALPGSVNAVSIDNNNEAWLGTDKGFSNFNFQEKIFNNYNIPSKLIDKATVNSSAINMVYDIVQDHQNPSVYWIATLGGLIKFNVSDSSFNLFRAAGNQYEREMNQFNKLVLHSGGNLYIGTWNLDLLVFNTLTEEFITHIGPNSSLPSLKYEEGPITPFFEKSKNEIWVGSLKGLGILDTRTNQINFIKSFKNKSGHRYRPTFLENYTGKEYWIGSDYGLQVYSPYNSGIKNYFFDPMDEQHWYLTNCMYESTNSGRLYLGYGRGEGLHYFNLSTGRFGVLPYERRVIREYNVYKILPISDKSLIFASQDELYRLDENKDLITPLNLPEYKLLSITDVIRDDEGSVWISGSQSGIRKYDLMKGEFESKEGMQDAFKTGKGQVNISRMAKDGRGRIWFAIRGKSYGYFIPENNELVCFDSSDYDVDIRCFYFSKDTLWAGTSRYGMGYFDPDRPQKGLIIKYDTKNYLLSDLIESIERDDKDRFWLLTASGIECIDPRYDNSIVVDEFYGLQKQDTWSDKPAYQPGVLYKLSNGDLVVGYRRGLGIFDPGSFQPESLRIIPYLSGIRIFDKEMNISQSAREKHELKLQHGQNYLSFDYSALCLSKGKSIKLYHLLEGIDLDWKESASQSASYSSLRPGKYVFKILAKQSSGLRSSAETAYTIIISPPWWNNSIAYFTYLILAISLLYFFYRFQIKRRLQQEENLRLRELDEFKTKLYANITHEFRTPLTVIMGVADDLKEDMDNKQTERFSQKIETIGRNSGNLLHLVNQMLDLAKLEHGRLDYNPIRSDIIPWLKYIVESHQSLAEGRDIQLTFYSETGSLIMDNDPDQLSKVISNLFSNAIKFTGRKGKVICHVKYEEEKNQLHIKVVDNGIGIAEDELGRIFDRFYQVDSPDRYRQGGTGIGLSLSKEIVEMAGGSILVKSQPGIGSEFEVILPVTQNALLTSVHPENFEKPQIYKVIKDNLEEDEAEIETRILNEKPLVLLAEDNPDVATYVRNIIRMKYKVKWAGDGDKALQMAFEYIPDIVISDVLMPGKNGYEVCQALKQDERTDHIPVILLTAKVTDADRISGYEQGADAYLTKPFNKKELLVRLEQLLKLRRQLQSKFQKLDWISRTDHHLSVEEQFIQKAARAIESKLDNSGFNAAFLAAELHLSESQLYRKLKAISGKSSAIFIRSVRLKKAYELLGSSPLSISEIAYQVGFSDPAWFSNVFKQEYGIRPSDAREKNDPK